MNTRKAGRLDELALHPTVKPVAMVADAIRDVSGRGDDAPAIAQGLPQRFLDPAWYDVNVHLSWHDLTAFFGDDPVQLDPMTREAYARMAAQRFGDEVFHHEGPVETFENVPAWRKADG